MSQDILKTHSTVIMNHFGVIRIVNLIATIIFAVITGLLIYSYIANDGNMAEELQEASNFDNGKGFILLAGIISFINSLVFAYGAYVVFQLFEKENSTVVAELIYILGVGKIMSRPPVVGEEIKDVSETSSLSSIYGFGHDDEKNWTFAGRKPCNTAEVKNAHSS